MSSAVVGTLKKSDAIFEAWREDDDCVPETMEFREKRLPLERQETDCSRVQVIVMDYVNAFANTNTLLFGALLVKNN